MDFPSCVYLQLLPLGKLVSFAKGELFTSDLERGALFQVVIRCPNLARFAQVEKTGLCPSQTNACVYAVSDVKKTSQKRSHKIFYNNQLTARTYSLREMRVSLRSLRTASAPLRSDRPFFLNQWGAQMAAHPLFEHGCRVRTHQWLFPGDLENDRPQFFRQTTFKDSSRF